jgi:hypothetical protein
MLAFTKKKKSKKQAIYNSIQSKKTRLRSVQGQEKKKEDLGAAVSASRQA